MNTPTAPLLKDIHLPGDIHWWPPAPGWWGLLVLSILVCILSFLLIRFIRKYWRKRQPYRQAKRILLEIQATYVADQNKQHLLQQLSILLRQAAMSYFGRQKIAGLTNQHWLQFLDAHLPGQHFTQGDGRVFAQLPYTAAIPTLDAAQTISLVQRWLDAAYKKNTLAIY